LKNVFEYVYSNGKRSRVIIDDKKLNDILVRFLNVKFYGEFEKVVDLFFGMREGGESRLLSPHSYIAYVTLYDCYYFFQKSLLKL